jgi:tetratricopeptide (TPR) repeat protein
MGFFDAGVSGVFASKASQSAQLEGFAKRALVAGLNQFSAKNYDQAITTFQRAIGLAPLTTTAIDAYDYLAKAYMAKGDPNAAIKAYQQSLRTDPMRDDTHVALGKVYTSEGRHAEALKQYEQAFKLKPTAANRYALAQGYLATERFGEAERQFELLRRQEPKEPYGSYGLGQTYAKQGRYAEAVTAFGDAIRVQDDYWAAYAEMGFALADMGETDKAQKVVEELKGNDDALAATLGTYIYEKTKPQMILSFNEDFMQAFPTSREPGTQVADLSSYLSDPGAERTFSMVFHFSKPMDEASVENIANWDISRSVDTGRGDGYNFNVILPETEIGLPSRPVSVTYDSEKLTATVLFTIRQNDSGDGTLDPSHVKFKFSGVDDLGLAMDPNADEYTGFSGFA